MRPKKWKILSSFDSQKPLISQILGVRGVTDVEKFLNPPKALIYLKSYFDREFFQNLSRSRERIIQAVHDSTPIIIYGDYDADGICATTILYNYFKNELNYSKVKYFIPNRFKHGYGLSINSLDECLSLLHPSEKALFITVDTGITANKEAQYLKDKGHSLIITDHHQQPPILPCADEIIWSDKVVGSTISWILSKALGSKDPRSISLAGLATVTDLQPLLELNRSIVKESLEISNNNPLPAIKKLLDLSGRKNSDVTTYDYGFVLGPRLNASGRIEDADVALKMLTSSNIDEITKYASVLSNTNVRRQDITLEMFDIAGLNIDDHNIPHVIVSSSSDYHEGVVGLVASKLVQRYYRPSIVISLTDGYGKGSARSIPGVNIIESLRKFSDLFTNLGGHPMAAGFTIKSEFIPVFVEEINKFVSGNYQTDIFEPSLEADMEILLADLTIDQLRELERLKPFGVGNKEPIFVTRNLHVSSINLVGKDNLHLSLRLRDNMNEYKAILFNGKEYFEIISLGDRVDIIYQPKLSTFNGKENIELTISDIKKSI